MSMNFNDEETKSLLPRPNFQDSTAIGVQAHPNYTEEIIDDHTLTYRNRSSKDNEKTDKRRYSLGSIDNEMNKEINQGAPTPKMQVLGVILVILAGMSFTGSNVIQKFVIPEVTFWQLLATRATIQTLVLGFSCAVLHFKYRPGKIPACYFIIRSILRFSMIAVHTHNRNFLFRQCKIRYLSWSCRCSYSNSNARPTRRYTFSCNVYCYPDSSSWKCIGHYVLYTSVYLPHGPVYAW